MDHHGADASEGHVHCRMINALLYETIDKEWRSQSRDLKEL